MTFRFQLNVEEKADCYVVDEFTGLACTTMMKEQHCIDWVNARKVLGMYTIVRVLKVFKVESTTTVTEI